MKRTLILAHGPDNRWQEQMHDAAESGRDEFPPTRYEIVFSDRNLAEQSLHLLKSHVSGDFAEDVVLAGPKDITDRVTGLRSLTFVHTPTVLHTIRSSRALWDQESVLFLMADTLYDPWDLESLLDNDASLAFLVRSQPNDLIGREYEKDQYFGLRVDYRAYRGVQIILNDIVHTYETEYGPDESPRLTLADLYRRCKEDERCITPTVVDVEGFTDDIDDFQEYETIWPQLRSLAEAEMASLERLK